MFKSFKSLKSKVSFILAALILFAGVWPAAGPAAPQIAAYAAEPDAAPGYALRGSIGGGAAAAGSYLDLQVYAVNAEAYTGFIDLRFDNTLFEIENEASFDAISPKGVDLYTDGFLLSELVSNSKGRIGFSWVARGMGFLDAKSSPVMIASIRLKIKGDAKKIYSGSIELNYSTEADTPAYIQTEGEVSGSPVSYSYNRSGYPQLSFDISYPGSSKPNPNSVRVTLIISNNSENALAGAEAQLAGRKFESNASGQITLSIPKGDYTYSISKAGYENAYGDFSISYGSTFNKRIWLKSTKEFVRELADNLKIVYAGNDSAGSVKRAIGLMTEIPGSGAEVSWESSSKAIYPNGWVFRQEEDTKVQLTAKVSKNGESASRSFDVIVPAKVPDEPEQSLVPPEIIPEENKDKNQTGQPEGPQGLKPGEEDTSEDNDAEKESGVDLSKFAKFEDIDSVYDWAGEAIGVLASVGIINGTSDTSFSPNDKVTRAQYITLLMRMLDKTGTLAPPSGGAGAQAPERGADANLAPPSGGAVVQSTTERVRSRFQDVPSNAYYADLVNRAASLGIVKGSKGKFNPNAPITREDMIVMTMRALELNASTELAPSGESWREAPERGSDVNSTERVLSPFQDASRISSYALSSMQQAVGNGLIQGSEGKLRPLASSTRAEAAVFLYRIYLR